MFYECPLELNITGRFLSSARTGLVSPLKSVQIMFFLFRIQIMFANQFGRADSSLRRPLKRVVDRADTDVLEPLIEYLMPGEIVTNKNMKKIK